MLSISGVKAKKRNAGKTPAFLLPENRDLSFDVPGIHIKFIKHLCRNCRTG